MSFPERGPSQVPDSDTAIPLRTGELRLRGMGQLVVVAPIASERGRAAQAAIVEIARIGRTRVRKEAAELAIFMS